MRRICPGGDRRGDIINLSNVITKRGIIHVGGWNT